MKVKELINKLNKIENKELDVHIKFALDKEDEIGYYLEPFAVETLFEDEVNIYADYNITKEDCEFIGQVDLKEAYRKMLNEEEKKYYHRINNLDIQLCETNHKYLMIHKWAKDNSHKWGIASFRYQEDEGYWYLKTYGEEKDIDWYDFGCLVNLGYKWIKELGWN